jgi:hypothetical protein
MTSARLLAACVLLCPGFMFAQQNRAPTAGSVATAGSEKVASGSDPWSISPNVEAKANVPQDPLARLETSQPPKYGSDHGQDKKTFFFPSPGKGFVIAPEALADNSCFAIRSYVMARDSKDSDSTHLVGYMTCVPSGKYQVRTVVGRPEMTPSTVVSK